MRKIQNTGIGRVNGSFHYLRSLMVCIVLCGLGLVALNFSQSAFAQTTTINPWWSDPDYRSYSTDTYVWHDKNGNGVRDLEDTGIVGAQVQLEVAGQPGMTQILTTGEHGYVNVIDFNQGITLTNVGPYITPFTLTLLSIPNSTSYTITHEDDFKVNGWGLPFRDEDYTDNAVDGVYTNTLRYWDDFPNQLRRNTSANVAWGIDYTPTTVAPVSFTIEETTVSGCYQNGGSKATVSTLVSWQGDPQSTLSAELDQGGNIQTGDVPLISASHMMTGSIQAGYGSTDWAVGGWTDLPKLQEVVFEVDADGVNGGMVTVSSVAHPSATVTANFPPIPSCQPVTCTLGQLGGAVYNDYNLDGVRQAGETAGLDSVTVTAYDVNNATYAASTDGFGNYALSVPAGNYPVRLEFTDIPASPYLSTSTQAGANNDTTVQFHNAATCDAHLGVNNPANSCEDDPMMAVSCFARGNPLAPTGVFTTPETATLDTLVGFSSSLTGTMNMTETTHLAYGADTGTIWGLAWDRFDQTLYQSAFLRRGAGLGPLGLGGLYQVDMSGPSPTSVPFVDVTTLGIDVGQALVLSNEDRGLTGEATGIQYDTGTFALVGKVGIGDMAIDVAGETLYFTNLHDRHLYALNTDDLSYIATPIPQDCTGGEMRPFATKVHEGDVFVGVVCDASISGLREDLKAEVYQYNPITQSFDANPIMSFPLTYPRGYPAVDAIPYDQQWNPWLDDYAQWYVPPYGNTGHGMTAPTPLFTDIEFDVDGSMVLGFGDRTAMRGGARWADGSSEIDPWAIAGGDILRAYASNGTYILEYNGQAGPATSVVGVDNAQGPGFGEFYDDNYCNTWNEFCHHSENVVGALAIRPGSGEVAVTLIDPLTFRSAGVRHLNNSTGQIEHQYEVYNVDAGSAGTFSKATGLGDVEFLCAAPQKLEIGNRVWWDDNLNGVQDPGADEPPIAGLTLELYLIDAGDTLINGQDLATVGSTLVATTVTDAQGRYYFSSLDDSDNSKVPTGYEPQTWISGTAVLANRTYQIRIPDWDGSTGALAANAAAIAANLAPGEFLYMAPGPNTGVGGDNVKPSSDNIAINTIQDTDAYDNPGNAAIVVNTGGPGENDHTRDFAFGGDLTVRIGNRVWFDANNDGEDGGGEAGIDNVTVELLDDNGTVISTTTTANGGYYLFTSDNNGDPLFGDDYQVRIPASNFGAGQPLQYYQSSLIDGGDPDNNTDLDDNGPGSGTGGDVTSALITIRGGTEPTSDGDDANGNLTVDFGFTAVMSLGNRVWLDADVDGTDNGGTETGVSGVTITLYDAADTSTVLSTTVTNGEGFYRFDNLAVGEYVVSILADQFDDAADPLFGLVSTLDTGAGPDQNDNGPGADPSAGLQSAVITLAVGGAPTTEPSGPDGANPETLPTTGAAGDANYDATIDFGFTSLSLGNRVFLDTNGDGLDNDGANAPSGPVTVNLYDAADTTTVLSTTETSADGYYRFDKLTPGSYVVGIPASEFGSGGDLEDWWSTTTGGTSENVDSDDNGLDPSGADTERTVGLLSAPVSVGVNSEPTNDDSADTEDIDQTNAASDANYDATVDFGLVQLSLGNRVWQDVNGDGQDDGTEPGFDAVVVNLLEADGVTPVLDAAGTPRTATTNADGYYRFDGLPTGQYVVQIPASEFGAGGPLAGWWSTTDGTTADNVEQDDNGLDPATPNGVRTDGVLSAPVSLAIGSEPTSEASGPDGANPETLTAPTTSDENYDATVDFGFVQLSLGNRVWQDVDGDGTDNAGAEAGLGGVTVNLLDSAGAAVLDAAGANVTTTTDADGYYRFDNLAPGSYIVELAASNFAAGAPLADWWSTTTTGTPENNDQDDNGIDQPTVAAIQADGIRSATVNLTLATENRGDPSNSGQTNGETLDQTGAASDNNYDATVDFGLVRMSLGNRVWIDSDGDGTDNNGLEAGPSGPVTLNLLDSTGTPVLDSTGTPITTQTDVNGYYRFDNLAPNTYIVEIPGDQFNNVGDPLFQAVSTTDNVGGTDGTDQNDNGVDDPTPAVNGIRSAPVTLTANQEAQGEISNDDGGADQTGAASDENYDATVDFGFLPPMSIGNRIWEDVDGDGTDNGGTEAGIADVTVNLYQAAAPTTVFTSTATDGSGYYRFDGLAAGDYIVEIPAAEFNTADDGDGDIGELVGLWSTTTGATSENVDQEDNGLDPAMPADVRTDGIRSATIGLTRGTENTGDPSNAPVETLDQTGVAADEQYDATVDFGFVRMSLGNRIWEDFNGNGLDDDDALVADTNAGFANVTVNLLDSGGAPVLDADGVAITTQTDGNGYYRFDNLPPGDYHMEIPASEFQTGGDLENWWSTTTAGSENVDQNDNGSDVTNPRTSGVRTSSTATLAIGSEPEGEASNGDGGALDQTGAASDPNYDATVDFGFVQLSLGNRVWIDADNDGTDNGGSELAPSGAVTLNLLDGAGAAVLDAAGNPRTTTTDANGYYRFDGLEPDTYQVEIPADQFDDPADPLYLHSSSMDDVGGALDVDQNDNGVGTDPRSGVTSTVVVLSRSGEPQGEASNGDGGLDQTGAASDMNYNATIDFGFVPPMSLGNRIWLDRNGNGLDDDGPNAPSGPVQVNLLKSDGTPALDADGNVITTTTTADGYYRFDALPPDDYMVEIPASEFNDPADPLFNWFSSATTADGADQNDDGVDEPNLAANGIRTAVVNLTLGAAPQGEVGGDGDLDQTDAALDENYNATMDLGFVQRDYGDLPEGTAANYLTDLANDGPRHILDGVTFLGSSVDAELDGQPNGAASGDDGSLVVGDDEDGVTFGELVPGASLFITVTASAPGFLSAWMDFEGDGLDQLAFVNATGPAALTPGPIADLNLTAAGTYVLEVTVPAAVPTENIFSRFRYAANAGEVSGPTGEAATGEVEDHVIPRVLRDYGDLPDATTNDTAPDYATSLADDGARHLILDTGNPFLGLGVDAEPDGQPNVRADGDDNADTNLPTGVADDEDGVTFDTPIMPGQPFELTVNAGTDGVLNAWIDFNGDGTLDAGEQIATEQALSAGPQQIIGIAPAVVADALYSRFRFTQNGGEAALPTGEAPNGEVEDYALMSLGDTIWLDNGIGGGGADNGQQDGGEQGIPNVAVELYSADQTPGVDTPMATTTTDGAGNYLFTGLGNGDYIVHLPAGNFAESAALDDMVSSDDASNGVGFDPDALVQDGDDNGVDTDARESNGISALPVTLGLGQEPSDIIDGNGLNSNLTVDFGFVQYDYGDLPDGTSTPANTYPVTLADDGARHVLDGVTFLGAGVDAEPDGQPSSSADGDDTEIAPDDEDGVSFDTPIMPGEEFQITVEASVDGFLNGWIDFNGDGTLDAGEQIALDEPLVAGANVLTITAPPAVTTGALYSRFRFSSDNPENTMLPTGPWENGEVEDYVLMSLGDTVWADDGAGDTTLQNNGVQDGSEMGIPDVVVELYNAGDDPLTATPLVTTTTNMSGAYSFTGLTPGDYIVYLPRENFVDEAVLDGYVSSDDEQNGVGLDEDTTPADNDDNGVDPVEEVVDGIQSQPVTLALGTEPDGGFHNPQLDFGVVPLVSVGNLVWFDINGDGKQQDVFAGGERPIEDAVVELLNPDGSQATDHEGTPVAATTTGTDGLYAFGDLLPGDYKIRVTPPAEYGPTMPAADADPDTNEANDDSNGVPTGNGAEVESPVFTLAADSEPAGADQSDAEGGVEPFGLPDNHSNLTIDFGFIQTVSVGNRVWEDRNADGVQDADEPAVPGAVVTLRNPDGSQATDANGDPVAPITTTVDGLYNFSNLYPGSYIVEVVPPGGYVPTGTPDDADPDTNPSNVDSNGLPTGVGQTVRSREVVLYPTTEPEDDEGDQVDPSGTPNANSNQTVDFGFIPLTSVGNYVWADNNADGLQGADEPALAGATVMLYASNGISVARDYLGNPIAAVTTGADGFYNFSNLLPGDYVVQVTPPEGYQPTQGGADPDDNPANDDSNGVPTGVGNVVASPAVTLDVRSEPTDDDGDQVDPSETPNENSNLTVDFGFVPLLSVGNKVWSDVNGDGVQDPTEPPVEGAVVTLLNPDGTPVSDANGDPVPPATTGPEGFYNFSDLLPGDYKVQVVPPDGYVPTVGGADPDESPANDDSNGLPTGTDDGAESPVFTLSPGDEPTDDQSDQADPSGLPDDHGNLTIDFGFIPLVSVGNRVWEDVNANGLQDPSEESIAGAVVTLLNPDDSPATDVNGEPVASQTTGADGFYNFGNLAPGEYMVQVVPPAGYRPTDAAADADPDSNEANDDSNGVPTGTESVVQSPAFTLMPGTEPTETDQGDQAEPSDVPDASSNLTVDFGFVPLVSLGSVVWLDLDGDGAQDAEEEGIAGAVVELLNADGTPATDADGNPVPPQTTGADGLYNFSNLLPGDYMVQVTPPDATYEPTDVPDDADPDSNPSNVDSNGSIMVANGNAIRSPVVTLSNGDEPTAEGEEDPSGLPDANGNLTVDFGFVQPVSVGSRVWADENANGIQEPGEIGLEGAAVELLNPDGTPVTDLDGNEVVSVTVTADGVYNFSNLPAGEYIIRVTPPDGYEESPTGADANPDSNPANDDSNGVPTGDGATVQTLPFTLRPGGEPTTEGEEDPSGTPDESGDLSIDFGFFRVLSLGNRIWFDDGAGDGIVNNGIIDGSEQGVEGVLIHLLDAERNPVLGADGQPLTTRTDGDGYYLFDMLKPGEYVLYIDPANFQPGGPLEGFQSSDVTEIDPNLDGDINDNGLDAGTAAIDGIYSGVVLLAYNAEPVDEQDERTGSATNDNSNLTIDFGFYQPAKAVILTALVAELDPETGTLHVHWSTAAEFRTLGFHIRVGSGGGYSSAKQLTSRMVLGKGAQGASYNLELSGAALQQSLGADSDPSGLYLWLVETEITGKEIAYGPVKVRTKLQPAVFLPLVSSN